MPHNCDIYGIKTHYPSNLIKHKTVVYQKTKKFKCELCSKTFARKDDLNSDLKTHRKGVKIPMQ